MANAATAQTTRIADLPTFEEIAANRYQIESTSEGIETVKATQELDIYPRITASFERIANAISPTDIYELLRPETDSAAELRRMALGSDRAPDTDGEVLFFVPKEQGHTDTLYVATHLQSRPLIAELKAHPGRAITPMINYAAAIRVSTLKIVMDESWLRSGLNTLATSGELLFTTEKWAVGRKRIQVAVVDVNQMRTGREIDVDAISRATGEAHGIIALERQTLLP